MRAPGEELLELCEQATNEVVIVAPFIKCAAIERLLGAIPLGTEIINCVTRWRPEEIAAGVSDIEVFDILQKRSAARLFIHPVLHAKYFRVDDKCLFGSCNLTGHALGWVTPANLELMFGASANDQRLREFERILFALSFEASERLKCEIAKAADIIAARDGARIENFESTYTVAVISEDQWLPLCTRPDNLFEIYAEEGIDRIVSWTLEAGRRDLRHLRIPEGLARGTFYKFVAATTQQTPLVQRIYEASSEAITPEAGATLVREFVAGRSCEYSFEQHWNTIKAWLLYFLPHLYRQPSGSNDLKKGMQLGIFS